MQNSKIEKENLQTFNEWFMGPIGSYLLELETKQLNAFINTLYGTFLLCLGEAPFIQTISQSPIPHKVWIHPTASNRQDCSPISSRQDKLPIGSDEIHLVYLAHCLEFVNNPHEVLRESFRVLLPEAHVVISGFNPWGLWGIWRLFARFRKRWPWTGKFISSTRLNDWLALLGFDVVSVHYYFFKPPLGFSAVMDRLKWLEPVGRFLWPIFGGSYMILAKKRVLTLTPIKPEWVKKEKLVVDSLAQPTTRNS